MRSVFWFVLAWILGATPVSAAVGPIAALESGRVEGVAEGGSPSVSIFRGIPFAAAPTGELRWAEPKPVEHWKGIRKATEFGPRCMQRPLFSDMMFRSPGVSEDCLYLNVWTPAKLSRSTKAKLPVLVYIYGGGFEAGDSSEKRYDGEALARRGIVVVTVNYRLGVFGFLAHPELTAESPHHSSGNYGLLDQITALNWVKRNIAAFGGNRDRVTIAGESAGSLSVNALMASPLSRTRLQGAIGESGALMQKLTPMALADAEQKGMKFANSIGAPTIAALRGMPAAPLLDAQAKANDLPIEIIVDGYALTEPPAATFEHGRAAHVPLLVGSNSQEAPAEAVLGDGAPTIANYRLGLSRTLGDKADAVFALYPARTDTDVLAAATALASDNFLALPTWKWFDLQRRTGAPTYYYEFTKVRPRFVTDTSGKPLPWGAVHSAEIEYALGNLDANPLYAWTDEDRKVSATMSGYFANFIKTGDPNGKGLPAWPRASLDPSKIRRQIIDVTTRSADFAEQRRYVAGESLIYMH